jgi:hypothetical protein
VDDDENGHIVFDHSIALEVFLMSWFVVKNFQFKYFGRIGIVARIVKVVVVGRRARL